MKKRFVFWLPDDLRASLDKEAKKQDRSIGWLIVEAIKLYLSNLKD